MRSRVSQKLKRVAVEAFDLEIEPHLRGNLAVARAAAATCSAATTTWAEAAKATVQGKTLTKERRRQVTDGRRQVYVVE